MYWRSRAVVERLVALPEDRLHEAGLDLLLGGELRGQIEHLHRAAEVALVELLGGGAHQVAVAPGHLDRVLGQGDDLLHRLDLVRGAEVGGVGHDLLRHRPVRELLPEVAEDLLGAGLDARGAEAAQVVLELLLALRLGGGGGDRLRDDAASRAPRPPAPGRCPPCAGAARGARAAAGRASRGREAARPAGAPRGAASSRPGRCGPSPTRRGGTARGGSGRGRRPGRRPRRAPRPRRGGRPAASSASTRWNSPITLSLCSAWKSRSTRGRSGCSACCRSAQPWISAAAPSTGASRNTATESATMRGGTRSARYWSISSRAERRSKGVSGRAERAGPRARAGVWSAAA